MFPWEYDFPPVSYQQVEIEDGNKTYADMWDINK